MCLSNCSNCEIVGLASTLSIAIAKDMSQEDIIVLAAFFTALGDNLAILAL